MNSLEQPAYKTWIFRLRLHTRESTSYLLIDENRKEIALFSGDTLFIGDVGRPDLAQRLRIRLVY